VYVFETEEIAGIPVIAMELLPGSTLKDRVRSGGPLPPAEAVDAILQVVDGLEAAHAAGILHRDVKPSNCFIDHDGTIKVGDFGLSIPMAQREGAMLTRRASFEGTPEFAAPEQILGEPLDLRADIYSVGATLFFLLTGHPPFEHADLEALIARIRTDPVRIPSNLESRISTELVALVRRCLAKQPLERPASYAELKRQLEPFASTATATAPVGLRAAATVFDLIILVPIAAALLGALVGSQVIRDPASAAMESSTEVSRVLRITVGTSPRRRGRILACRIDLGGQKPAAIRAPNL
jgi:serine/threonine protein kinase